MYIYICIYIYIVRSTGHHPSVVSYKLHLPPQLYKTKLAHELRKALALIWYRALTWYILRLSSPRTHFESWKAVGTRGRGSLAARSRVAGRPAQ